MKKVVHLVDNRTFLLGLDELYRAAIKRHERGELLTCARLVSAELRVSPANSPIEGYYSEDAALGEYFLLMRSLQAQPATRKSEIRSQDEFSRLLEVTSSRIYGKTTAGNGLLPAGLDPLSAALTATFPNWSIENLVSNAYDRAKYSDDYSLVALASLSRDSIVLTALRESVVLYAYIVAGGLPPKNPEYAWAVDSEITERATRFVTTFNALFDEDLPRPCEGNASTFFNAADIWGIAGRCVRIGYDDSVDPIRHYHWAIPLTRATLVAEEFWDNEIWTTDRYRNTRNPRTRWEDIPEG